MLNAVLDLRLRCLQIGHEKDGEQRDRGPPGTFEGPYHRSDYTGLGTLMCVWGYTGSELLKRFYAELDC